MRSAKRNNAGGSPVSRSKLSRGAQRRPDRSHISRRPFVAATFAMTVDGKVTTRNFSPVDFTSREDKLHLFGQRALADAVRSEERRVGKECRLGGGGVSEEKGVEYV